MILGVFTAEILWQPNTPIKICCLLGKDYIILHQQQMVNQKVLYENQLKCLVPCFIP